MTVKRLSFSLIVYSNMINMIYLFWNRAVWFLSVFPQSDVIDQSIDMFPIDKLVKHKHIHSYRLVYQTD